MTKWISAALMCVLSTAAMAGPLLNFAPKNFSCYPWMGVSIETGKDSLTLNLAPDAKNYCGVNINLNSQLKLTDEIRKGIFSFEINGITDGMDKTQMQLGLTPYSAENKKLDTRYVPFTAVDNDKTTWQTVTVPMAKLVTAESDSVKNINFQFQVLPANRGNIEIRSIAIINPEPAGQ